MTKQAALVKANNEKQVRAAIQSLPDRVAGVFWGIFQILVTLGLSMEEFAGALASSSGAGLRDRIARLIVDAVRGTAAGPEAGLFLKKKLRTWVLKMGGSNLEQYLRVLKEKGVEIGDWALDILKKPEFTYAREEEEMLFTDLSPADLGFLTNPTTTELFDEDRLARWSSENLAGYKVELCPAEAAIAYRIAYTDQPKGQVVWIAMKPMCDSRRDPGVLSVERYDDGRLWLDAYCADPDGTWDLGPRLLFRLRKI